MTTAIRRATIAVVLSGILAAPPPARGQSSDDDPFAAPVLPLVAKQPRDEATADRVTAEANYAYGRLLLRREDDAGALRRFERAYRYDPTTVDLMREVVPLAARLNRIEEVARYGVLAAEQGVSAESAETMIQLGGLLTEQRHWKGALRLFQQLSRRDEGAPRGLVGAMIQLELGRLHYLADEPKPAAEAFARAIKALDHPADYDLDDAQVKRLLEKPSQTYQLMGEAFFDAERWDEARGMFRRAFADERDETQLRYHEARIALAQNRLDEALALLEKYFGSNASDAGVEPYELFVEVWEKKEADAATAARRARERLTALQRQFPSNVPLTLVLAEQSLAAKDWDTAEKLYLTLRKQRSTLEVDRGLVQIYLERENPAALWKILGPAVVRLRSIDLFEEFTKALAERPEFAQKLLAHARAATARDAADGQEFAAALVAIKLKELDLADVLFRRAIADSVTAADAIYLAWGRQLLLANAPERAAKVLREAIDAKVRPEANGTFLYFLAGALELAGQTDEAIAVGQQALAAGDKTPTLLSRIAWIPYHAKRYEAAEQAYLKLLEKFDGDYSQPEVRETCRDTRLILSNICVKTERLPQAEQWIEEVLDEFPEDVGALNDLGYLWADQCKHPQRALAMCRRAVSEQPENRAYRDSLGWALYRVGKYEEAIVELAKAIDRDEPDGLIWDHLADAHWRAKHDDAARAAWRKAAEIYRQNKELEKAAEMDGKVATPPAR